MKNIDTLNTIVASQKKGIPAGITSICSYNKYVIEAALQLAGEEGSDVLIESTSNQVNQFGGYTDMVPVDFKEYIYSIALSMEFPAESSLRLNPGSFFLSKRRTRQKSSRFSQGYSG